MVRIPAKHVHVRCIPLFGCICIHTYVDARIQSCIAYSFCCVGVWWTNHGGSNNAHGVLSGISLKTPSYSIDNAEYFLLIFPDAFAISNSLTLCRPVRSAMDAGYTRISPSIFASISPRLRNNRVQFVTPTPSLPTTRRSRSERLVSYLWSLRFVCMHALRFGYVQTVLRSS